jgi:FKBP-type peptidyl-prolyl cis-trans isomerase FkpA
MNLRKINVVIVIAAIGIALAGCDTGKFKTSEDGFEYKYVRKGDGKMPTNGEVVVFNIKYTDEKDSLLFESTSEQPVTIPYDSAQWNMAGPLYKAFKIMGEGDSILVRIPTKTTFAESFRAAIPPGIDPEGFITFYVGAKNIMTASEMRAEDAKKNEAQLQLDIEKIERYLEQNAIVAQSTESGLRYVINSESAGDRPKPGNTVSVHYTGKLMDGTIFDSSEGKDPIQFVIGRGAVIRGWDEGIMLLNKGSKATFYIPSGLAYGPPGRSPVIPPNSILMFDVELVGIN